MKKLEPIEALAKIKIKLKKYYESIGVRGKYEISFDMDEKREELIEKIDDIIHRVKIPAKNLIVEEFDEEVKPNKENDIKYDDDYI